MGIKNLNSYLLKNCSRNSIYVKPLSHFADSTISIDTFIYLYKFIGEGHFEEKLTSMIDTLKKHDITPLFVFDGKPPAEKYPLLCRRNAAKLHAEKLCKYKQRQLDDANLTDDQKLELQREIASLKKQCVRITPSHIETAKQIMDELDVQYVTAFGEADHLCVKLVTLNEAVACMSDDMDMFAHGCAAVLREFNAENETVLYYDTTRILRDINLSMHSFCDILILSGTDYSVNNSTSLYTSLKHYHIYLKQYTNVPFYEWLHLNTSYVQDYEKLLEIRQMFLPT